MWNYDRQLIEPLGWTISPVANPATFTGNTEETLIDVHTSRGIRNHDPNVLAGEDISFVTPHGHCDRHICHTQVPVLN
jgi:hypothetical protein